MTSGYVVSGIWLTHMELLQKAFTNIPLNAIQSLPKGHGAVDIGIGKADPGNTIMAIRDNCCGIPPEHMQKHHRPFQIINEHDAGIGLCHTSPIVERDGDPYPDRQPIKPRPHGGSAVRANLSVWEMGVDQ